MVGACKDSSFALTQCTAFSQVIFSQFGNTTLVSGGNNTATK